MIRIGDISVFDNPDRLREIADILSSRDIPFMVGVIPFFVDPGEGIRVSLSDKPDLVDALQYMVRNGGTIVMHGSRTNTAASQQQILNSGMITRMLPSKVKRKKQIHEKSRWAFKSS